MMCAHKEGSLIELGPDTTDPDLFCFSSMAQDLDLFKKNFTQEEGRFFFFLTKDQCCSFLPIHSLLWETQPVSTRLTYYFQSTRFSSGPGPVSVRLLTASCSVEFLSSSVPFLFSFPILFGLQIAKYKGLLTWLEKYRLPFFCKTNLCFHYILCQELLSFVNSPEGGKHQGVPVEKYGKPDCIAIQ